MRGQNAQNCDETSQILGCIQENVDQSDDQPTNKSVVVLLQWGNGYGLIFQLIHKRIDGSNVPCDVRLRGSVA